MNRTFEHRAAPPSDEPATRHSPRRWSPLPEVPTIVWPPTVASRCASVFAALVAISLSARSVWEMDRIVSVIVVVAVIVLTVGTRRWSATVGALCSGCVVGVLLAPSFGVLAAVNLWLALHAVGRIELPSSPPVSLDRVARTVMCAGLVLASVVTVRTDLALLPAAVSATSVVLALAARRFVPSGVERGIDVIDRIALRAGRFVGASLALLLAGPVLLIAWLGQAMTRFDPLSADLPSGTRWATRFGVDPAPYRAYALVATERHRPTARRLHRFAAAAVSFAIVIGVIAGGLVVAMRLPNASSVHIDQLPPAAEEEPWYPDLFDDLGRSQLKWSQPGLFVTNNVRSRYVNVTDGRRRTWQPPVCECPTIDVWVFGGSTAYGYFQRDSHTLASELARRAYRDGIRLEVTNFAVPAYTLWQEVERFQYLLTVETDRPDLVLFYDGANELGIQTARNEDGYGDDESPGSALDRPMRVLFPRALDILGWSSRPWDAYVAPLRASRGPSPHLESDVIARHAIARYERAVDAARAVAVGSGVTAEFAWQPLFEQSQPQLAAPDLSAAGTDEWGRTVQNATGMLPDGVSDLSGSLDALDEPVYLDSMHLNEKGTAVVAEAWYERLKPTLSRLDGG